MSLTIGLILLAVLGAIVYWWRRQQPPVANGAPADTEQPGRQRGQYHAVSIRLGDDACEAAHELRGHRFLSSEAPRLPLRDCDAPVCNCCYVHYRDRRSGIDRRSPFQTGFGAAASPEDDDRRRKRDRRRAADDDTFFE